MPTTPRRVPSLDALSNRVEALERSEILYKMTVVALEKADSSTATAVERLASTINDPEAGLIVQLKLFRLEVAADRQAFRSWVRGATAVIGAVIAIFTIAAPWIRLAVESALRIPPSGP